MSRLEFTHLKGVELILTLPYPVSYYINCLYNKWKSIKKCFKSAANLQSLFKGIVLACVQSGQKPGSFSQEMRFKLQQFMRKASNLWMKHTIYLTPYESEITFNHNILLSHSEFSHLSANKCYHTLAVYSINCWRERVCEYASSSLETKGPYWGPVRSLWVLLPIWPGQISLLYPGDDISKNHLSRPCSFRGDRCLSFPVFFRLVFY